MRLWAALASCHQKLWGFRSRFVSLFTSSNPWLHRLLLSHRCASSLAINGSAQVNCFTGSSSALRPLPSFQTAYTCLER